MIRGKGGVRPGVVHSIKREKNILGVRGVGILDGVGWGRGKRKRKRVSLHLLSLLFASLLPLSLRKALYSG